MDFFYLGFFGFIWSLLLPKLPITAAGGLIPSLLGGLFRKRAGTATGTTPTTLPTPKTTVRDVLEKTYKLPRPIPEAASGRTITLPSPRTGLTGREIFGNVLRGALMGLGTSPTLGGVLGGAGAGLGAGILGRKVRFPGEEEEETQERFYLRRPDYY